MTSQITFNLLQGSVRFSFSPEVAQGLKQSLGDLMASLKAIADRTASGGRRSPEPSLEYQHAGEIFLEVFCNPNIWPNPFAAKLLITVRDDRIRLTTEAELPRILEDVNQYLETVA
ncbi:hypothetical protein [Leptolyngbya sp. PCC 6406]|uniref:hypothetical protein n=1 Tax=Leptolyngbya sp. PCC 6406 TaxID=1173264 RepID=UPI0002AC86DA|nr:hypothetical protein [Leptolyngbya sp. PCC 6406]